MKLPQRRPPISLDPMYVYRDVNGRWERVHVSDLPRDESRETRMPISGVAAVSVRASDCGT